MIRIFFLYFFLISLFLTINQVSCSPYQIDEVVEHYIDSLKKHVLDHKDEDLIDDASPSIAQSNPEEDYQDKKIDTPQKSNYDERRAIKNDQVNTDKATPEPTSSASSVTNFNQRNERKKQYHENLERLKKDPCQDDALNKLLEIAKVWETDKKQQKKVIHIYQMALKCRPGNVSLLFDMGKVYMWMGKNKEAESALLAALIREPKNEEIASLLTKVFIRQNKLKNAQDLLNKYPTYPENEKDRALIALKQNDLHGAQIHYENALDKDNKDVVATRGLARSLAGQKKFKESKKVYKQLTDLEPKNHYNWREYMLVRSYTNIGIRGSGGYTKSKETDPNVGAPVVDDFYTSAHYEIFIPILDRWRIDLKQLYFHQKEDDIYFPMGLNYNVYIHGAQITSNALFWKNFKWDVVLRLLGARGYNNNAFFPFKSKALFEPGTSFIYSSSWQFIILNSHVESMIIKNFKREISQLLRMIYIHAGYVLKPNVALRPELELTFNEVFYHDNLHNRRNTFFLWARVNVYKNYLRLLYKFRQSNFTDLSENYYTYRRQLRNAIGGIFNLELFSKFRFQCIYEHWWKYTAGLLQPIGLLIFSANKQRLQGDKITFDASYEIRDFLRLEAGGHLLYSTLPYNDYNVRGAIYWQF